MSSVHLAKELRDGAGREGLPQWWGGVDSDDFDEDRGRVMAPRVAALKMWRGCWWGIEKLLRK